MITHQELRQMIEAGEGQACPPLPTRYSCAGAVIVPRQRKWSHGMARYTVGQFLAELQRFEPEVLVVWHGQFAVEVTLDVVAALYREKGIRFSDENRTSPFLMAVPRPGFAVLTRNPRRR